MADQSSSSDLRPDLDESINVPEAHAALRDGIPAVSREKRLLENGMEPVALPLILICGIVMLVGGAVLGQGGGFFKYGELVKNGYMRGPAPGGEEKKLLPMPALKLLRKEGQKHYASCAGCHQSDGSGQGGEVPPLAGSEWVTGSTERLALIMHNGITGNIEVAGVTYTGKQMAAIGASLGKKELASLMTYLRTSWGNDASIVTLEMAEKALEISKARGGGQVTVEELNKNHNKMLPGAPLAPDTLLDPETFEPASTGAAEAPAAAK